MDSVNATINPQKLAAFVLPMAALLLFLGIGSVLGSKSQYWIYPVQTVVCGLLLLVFWREYEFRAVAQPFFTIAIGLVVFAIWIAPQFILRFPPRLDGFDPEIFSGRPVLYAAMIGARFLRLVLVVPLVEEIFFRGFLLRYLIKDAFHLVPIGAFSRVSFSAVAVCFGLVHSRSDWIAGVVAGVLYNLVVYRTKSLASAVLAHATTNLLLGFWIMKTGQWGFW